MTNQSATREDLDRVTSAFTVILSALTTPFTNQINGNHRKIDKHQKLVKVQHDNNFNHIMDSFLFQVKQPPVNERPLEKEEAFLDKSKEKVIIHTITESLQEICIDPKESTINFPLVVKEAESEPIEYIRKLQDGGLEDDPKDDASIILAPKAPYQTETIPDNVLLASDATDATSFGD